MLYRYRRTSDGKTEKVAVVYTKPEHGIDRSLVDPNAVRVVETLERRGYEAYVVGGAVRDLLVGRSPKDFDIVTDAQPQQIRRLFANARIIGRRFRLVHVVFGSEIYEVSTFRSIRDGTVGNEYGTMDEDVRRRDFTANALYYDPVRERLVDYVGGLKDVRGRVLKPVIPLASIFVEDPVRMMRCVKYSVTCGFRIPLLVRLAVRRNSALLRGVSCSRLTEELLKILFSGRARGIVELLARFGLLEGFLPRLAEKMATGAKPRKSLLDAFDAVDLLSGEVRERRIGRVLAPLALECFDRRELELAAREGEAALFRAALASLRASLEPLNLPRLELEIAVTYALRAGGFHSARPQRELHGKIDGDPDARPPARRRRRRGGRGRGSKDAAGGGETGA